MRGMSKPPKPSPDDVLTTAEAATLLGLSARQVCEHAEAGRLPGRKLNPRMWIFRRGDVEQFVPRPRGRPKSAGEPAPTSRGPRRRGRAG